MGLILAWLSDPYCGDKCGTGLRTVLLVMVLASRGSFSVLGPSLLF